MDFLVNVQMTEPRHLADFADKKQDGTFLAYSNTLTFLSSELVQDPMASFLSFCFRVLCALISGAIVEFYSPNRFTCEGFLLLLKGCMLGPDDFEFVSGLVFLAA